MRRSVLLGGTSSRERRLAPRLDSELAPIGAVMHGCRLRDVAHRIDHLIVAPSGIWTVVAEHSTGRVSVDGDRVGIDGVDLTGRLTAAAFAAQRVRQVLVDLELDWLDVTPTLCFTTARVKIGAVDSAPGVRLSNPRTLVREAVRPGPLLQSDARRIAGAVGRHLVIDGEPTRRS